MSLSTWFAKIFAAFSKEHNIQQPDLKTYQRKMSSKVIMVSSIALVEMTKISSGYQHSSITLFIYYSLQSSFATHNMHLPLGLS